MMEYSTVTQVKEVIQQETETVKGLIKRLGLQDACLAVIVDGEKASMDQVIREGQKVIVLPTLAGGC